jgi:hypothetical protein
LLADVEGVLVMIPSEIASRNARMILSPQPIIIGGHSALIDGEKFLVADCLSDLLEASEQATNAKKIVLNLKGLNSPAVKKLCGAMRNYPGNTVIDVSVYEDDAVRQVERLEERKVCVCPPLIESLKSLLPPESITILNTV